jgi:hypothetical protein
MRKSSALHIGLDVHANSIDVTAAETGAGREVRHVGSIGGDLASLDRVLRKLRSDGAKLHVVYEAGPCGFVIARHLREQAIDCEVVAPSMIPRRPGERIKTDRRDSVKLARLARAGELTAVLGGAAAAVRALPAVGRSTPVAAKSGRGDRTRAGRVRLGDRPDRRAAALNELPLETAERSSHTTIDLLTG